ncbi:MAG: 50S ribosomal protein L17 [Bacteroidota bacterium]
MRHGKKNNHLGRNKAHRDALLSNMASSLLLHKRITTTVAKAKVLRKYVEPLITKAKTDSTHSRRTVFSYLQNKESIQALFGEVATRTADRPGGYTRIIKLGDARLGDAAEMCMMELVDFNDTYKKDGAEKKAKTRRSRKGKKADGVTDATVVEDAPKAEAKEKKAKKAPKKEKE